MFYKSIENANAEAEQRIKDYQAVIDMAPAVIKVIKEFDGKVYNVKFGRAIGEATNKKIYVSNHFNDWLEVYGYPQHNYSMSIYLLNFRMENLNEGKRIPADKMLEEVSKRVEGLKQSIEDIKYYRDSMAEIRETVEMAIDNLNSFLQSFPSDVREIYDIPYTLRIH